MQILTLICGYVRIFWANRRKHHFFSPIAFGPSIGKFLYLFYVLPTKTCSTFVKFEYKRLIIFADFNFFKYPRKIHVSGRTVSFGVFSATSARGNLSTSYLLPCCQARYCFKFERALFHNSGGREVDQLLVVGNGDAVVSSYKGTLIGGNLECNRILLW